MVRWQISVILVPRWLFDPAAMSSMTIHEATSSLPPTVRIVTEGGRLSMCKRTALVHRHCHPAHDRPKAIFAARSLPMITVQCPDVVPIAIAFLSSNSVINIDLQR